MACDLLTNHGHVLLCVAREPGMRLREIASCVGITERAAHRIVCELEQAGYLSRHREGRRNFYEIHPDRPLRHPLERHHTIGEILRVLLDRPESQPPAGEPAASAPAPPPAGSRRARADDGVAARPPPDAPSYGDEGWPPSSAAGTDGSSRRSRSAAARRARFPRRS